MNAYIDPLDDDQDAAYLDDFDSDEFEDDGAGDNDYVSGMWGGFGYGRTADLAERAIIAHGMISTFVNAFARGGRYRVTFSPGIKTAGTDLDGRQVYVTTAPLDDQTLTVEQAGLVLTGMAAHEVSHDRYGRSTAEAVRRVFGRQPLPSKLSNLLDDIRIERRFAHDFPGYAGIFTPTLEYVGKMGGRTIRPTLARPADLAIAATRFPTTADWGDPRVAAERDWWQAWAARWAVEDAPRRHVAAIREALRHVAQTTLDQERETSPSPRGDQDEQSEPQAPSSDDGDDTDDDEPTGAQGDAQGDEDESDRGAGAEGDASEDEDNDELDPEVSGMSDEELGAQREAPAASSEQALGNGELNGEVEAAARQNGAVVHQADADIAERAVQESKMFEDDGLGGKVDVLRDPSSVLPRRGGSRGWQRGSDHAAAAIRNAFMRSRGGHTATSRGERRGRLDSHSLARIAEGRGDLFSRRTAPSERKLLVWVMVDCSVSMAGQEVGQAAQVAHAMAEATRSAGNVRMAVWAWTSAFRQGMTTNPSAGAARVWQSGEDTRRVFDLVDLPHGGTPDARVLSWAGAAIKREARSDESPMILFCSDGEGQRDMTDVVEQVRRQGVDVRGVSFGAGLGERGLLERFGRGGSVPFRGSIMESARPLASLVGEAARRASDR